MGLLYSVLLGVFRVTELQNGIRLTMQHPAPHRSTKFSDYTHLGDGAKDKIGIHQPFSMIDMKLFPG